MKLVPGGSNSPSSSADTSDLKVDGDFSYRVIRTARTLDEINAAVRLGYRPLLKHVVPGPKIHDCYTVYRHRPTGQICMIYDMRDERLSDDNYEQALPWRGYYQYHFPSPFAAYLVPPDIQEGEKVFLADLIEDFVERWGAQGDNYRLKSYFATWTNGDFLIDYDAERDAPYCVG